MLELTARLPPIVAEGRLWVDNRHSIGNGASGPVALVIERRDLPYQQRFIAEQVG